MLVTRVFILIRYFTPPILKITCSVSLFSIFMSVGFNLFTTRTIYFTISTKKQKLAPFIDKIGFPIQQDQYLDRCSLDTLICQMGVGSDHLFFILFILLLERPPFPHIIIMVWWWISNRRTEAIGILDSVSLVC